MKTDEKADRLLRQASWQAAGAIFVSAIGVKYAIDHVHAAAVFEYFLPFGFFFAGALNAAAAVNTVGKFYVLVLYASQKQQSSADTKGKNTDADSN